MVGGNSRNEQSLKISEGHGKQTSLKEAHDTPEKLPAFYPYYFIYSGSPSLSFLSHGSSLVSSKDSSQHFNTLRICLGARKSMYQPTPGMAPWYLKTCSWAGSLGSENRVFKPTIQPDVLELGHKGHCGLPVCQTHVPRHFQHSWLVILVLHLWHFGIIRSRESSSVWRPGCPINQGPT